MAKLVYMVSQERNPIKEIDISAYSLFDRYKNSTNVEFNCSHLTYCKLMQIFNFTDVNDLISIPKSLDLDLHLTVKHSIRLINTLDCVDISKLSTDVIPEQYNQLLQLSVFEIAYRLYYTITDKGNDKDSIIYIPIIITIRDTSAHDNHITLGYIRVTPYSIDTKFPIYDSHILTLEYLSMLSFLNRHKNSLISIKFISNYEQEKSIRNGNC